MAANILFVVIATEKNLAHHLSSDPLANQQSASVEFGSSQESS